MWGLKRVIPLLVLIIAVLPVTSYAQSAGGDDTYVVDINEILNSYGLSDNERIVTFNVDNVITMENPLVIMGDGADVLERQGFDIYTSNNPDDPAAVLDDDERTYMGQSIDNYDLILIGGPDHNAYTKELLDKGIIKYKTTDLKMPGAIIESEQTPQGHVVLVVGDVDGYPYHKKDLPLNGIIPEKYAATTAVVLGASLGLMGALSSVSNFLSSIWDKLFKFVWGYVTTHASETASEKESEARNIKVAKNKKAIFLGYSAKEILAAVASAILFGIAFVVADRLDLLPANILIYIFTGGLVLALHDLGHRIVAHFMKVDSEFQFWGLGTITMLLTSWLFGLAFAQPGRFLLEKEGAQPKKLALITLAGPAISLLFSIAFLPLVFFGGVATQIGMLGFTMNLVTAVYTLMPFSPMDGKPIFDWSKLFWALLFIPITLFFVLMTYFVLG